MKQIQKTLSLRIVRPYYTEEIENDIKAEKARLELEGKKAHLKPQFYTQLKKKYPDMLLWKNIRTLFIQLQKNVTESYNESISQLYITRIINNEGGSMDVLLSKYIYKKAYQKLKSAYIALGVRQKIKSNFKEKELRSLRQVLPTAKSDTFPIPFSIQEGVKLIENDKKDLIVEIPFPLYKTKEKIDKYRPWEKYEFIPRKTTKIQFLLSINRRKRNKTWIKDNGTDAEIRKIISGEYKEKITWLEINKGKKIGEKNQWFVNFTIKISTEDKNPDKNIIGGIDIGISNPLVCAVSNSLKRLTIRGNDIIAFNIKVMARRRSIMRQNYTKRKGHGSKNKMKIVTRLTEKSENHRKKIMEKWVVDVARFFVREGVGLVQMEDLSGLKNRDEETDFFKYQRMYWPYYMLQQKLENKFKENGIKVKIINPAYTSQICHSCGERNEYFTFEYRKNHNFPEFQCKKCGKVECPADYNAAKNMANPDIEEIAKKFI